MSNSSSNVQIQIHSSTYILCHIYGANTPQHRKKEKCAHFLEQQYLNLSNFYLKKSVFKCRISWKESQRQCSFLRLWKLTEWYLSPHTVWPLFQIYKWMLCITSAELMATELGDGRCTSAARSSGERKHPSQKLERLKLFQEMLKFHCYVHFQNKVAKGSQSGEQGYWHERLGTNFFPCNFIEPMLNFAKAGGKPLSFALSPLSPTWFLDPCHSF